MLTPPGELAPPPTGNSGSAPGSYVLNYQRHQKLPQKSRVCLTAKFQFLVHTFYFFFQKEENLVQLNELDELDSITQA